MDAGVDVQGQFVAVLGDERMAPCAVRMHVAGVVQGVGFRPFVYRLARACALEGWVLNGGDGVSVQLQGPHERVLEFGRRFLTEAPAAARIDEVTVHRVATEPFDRFEIRESTHAGPPTTRMSPDLPVCEKCLAELFDPRDPRYHYPYINCTDCGPRYSLITGLPYDRPLTTMAPWAMCDDCDRAYKDPRDRRFHAQPTACPRCGPAYYLGPDRGDAAIAAAAVRLRRGEILAVKGIGGYHLACDARNLTAVQTLRDRKYRKDKPFALMGRDLDELETVVTLSADERDLLTSVARPIVLATASEGVGDRWREAIAPDNRDVGVMLPYAPVHNLLFEAGAPALLILTSANRSSEPIAYEDGDALERLGELADAFLVGERPIARRVEDSVARAGPLGPVVLRHGRGYAPGVVASLPSHRPILALGGDLKNTLTLVVDGQALVSQYIGDLEHEGARAAFRETVRDLVTMYEVDREALLVAHDAHPEYVSAGFARELGTETVAVQHHRAHIASVLAEHGALSVPVVGAALDGTGYGDDGTIWGGEIFAGTARDLRRIAHLRPAPLPGGDAAAKNPVQAAAGFLAGLVDEGMMTDPPFDFPHRYVRAAELVARDFRCFRTTSAGRLFDTAAALCGFIRPLTFEGQAAVWLEHQARGVETAEAYPFPNLDYRPLLEAVIADRRTGRPVTQIAHSFHAGVAAGLWKVLVDAARAEHATAIVLSGGVMQNALLVRLLVAHHREAAIGVPLWINQRVPPNDGGVSLGQAAIAAVGGR